MSSLLNHLHALFFSERLWFFAFGYAWCMLEYKIAAAGWKKTLRFCWCFTKAFAIISVLVGIVVAVVYGITWLAAHDWLYPTMTFGMAVISVLVGVFSTFYFIESADK